jgi:hypothetical protein
MRPHFEACFPRTDESETSYPRYYPVPLVKVEQSVILVKPEDALDRIVVFGYSVTDRRGRKSTPADIYNRDFKKEMANRRLYVKRLKEIREKKIKNVPMREVPEVPSFSKLPKDVQTHYRQRAEQEMDYKYYRVHAVDMVSPAVAPASRMEEEALAGGSSSSSAAARPSAQDVALERNSAAFIKPGSAPYVLTLFETHHGGYQRALAYQQKHKNTVHAVVSVSWINFIRNSFVLSDEDVETSKCLLPLPDECSECPPGKKKVSKNLEFCDGSPFPGRGPTAFPCNRLAVCPDCREKTCYRKTESWFCRECTGTPRTFTGIYGNKIGTPRDDALCRDVSRLLPAVNGKPRVRVNVVVRPLGAPVIENGTHHNPARDYKEFCEKSALTPELTWVQQQKKAGAEHLLDMFTEAALSSGQQEILIKGLNKMQAEKIIKTEHDVKIFGQPRLLLERAERGGDGNSFGSTPTTYYLDSSGLLQGQADVPVVLLNPLHTLQRIVLKPEVPNGALYIGDGEYLSFKNDGASAVGGQVYQKRYTETDARVFLKRMVSSRSLLQVTKCLPLVALRIRCMYSF